MPVHSIVSIVSKSASTLGSDDMGGTRLFSLTSARSKLIHGSYDLPGQYHMIGCILRMRPKLQCLKDKILDLCQPSCEIMHKYRIKMMC